LSFEFRNLNPEFYTLHSKLV